MSKQSVRYTIHFFTAVSITAMVLFVIYGMQNGLFTDRTKMEMLIERGGIFGPLFFIFIQMVQVVVPIIPGGISCAAGVILFGPCAPDDFLCMLAGLTKMSWKRFSAIILLGKPGSIAIYSLALVYAGTWISGLQLI